MMETLVESDRVLWEIGVWISDRLTCLFLMLLYDMLMCGVFDNLVCLVGKNVMIFGCLF